MTPKQQPRLVVISAPSGAGKTTLCRMALEDFPQLTLSISTTTRPRRPQEKNGVHYHFVDDTVFDQKIKAEEFAEWAEVHGNRYGTTKATIENALAAGNHVLFDIDYQGALALQKAYPDRTLLVFVRPPSMEDLERRLVARQSDSSKAIAQRLQNAYTELEWSEKFDYQITNDELSRAYESLKAILKKECR